MEIAAHGVYSLLASPKVFGVLIIWPVQIVNVKGRSGCLLANLTTVVSSIAGMSSLVMTEFDLVRFPFWAKVMACVVKPEKNIIGLSPEFHEIATPE